MHWITERTPRLVNHVRSLWEGRAALRTRLEGLAERTDQVSWDDALAFKQICADLVTLLEDLQSHGQEEVALLQRSMNQDEGGTG